MRGQALSPVVKELRRGSHRALPSASASCPRRHRSWAPMPASTISTRSSRCWSAGQPADGAAGFGMEKTSGWGWLAAFSAYLFPGAGRGPDSARSAEGTLARASFVKDWTPAFAGEQRSFRARPTPNRPSAFAQMPCRVQFRNEIRMLNTSLYTKRKFSLTRI